MSFSNDYERFVLRLLFRNQDITDLGDSSGCLGSSTAGSLYVALHTADPTDAGDQTTDEVAYTSYARVGVNRDTSSWTSIGNVISNASAVQFPTCTGGSATATHFSIGVDDGTLTLAPYIICYGALPSPLTITSGVQPQFAAGALVITLD